MNVPDVGRHTTWLKVAVLLAVSGCAMAATAESHSPVDVYRGVRPVYWFNLETSDPAAHVRVRVYEFWETRGLAGTPPRYLVARKSTPTADGERVEWTTSHACPALRDVSQLVPVLATAATTGRSPAPPAPDGVTVTLSIASAAQIDGSPVGVQVSSNAGPLAHLGRLADAALSHCWRPTEPPAL